MHTFVHAYIQCIHRISNAGVVAEGNIPKRPRRRGISWRGVGLGRGADKGRNPNHNDIKCVTPIHVTIGDQRSPERSAIGRNISDQRSLRTVRSGPCLYDPVFLCQAVLNNAPEQCRSLVGKSLGIGSRVTPADSAEDPRTNEVKWMAPT